MAKREHRSINNFVECLLYDVVYNEPNEITKAAMEEAKSGILRGTTPVDTSSVEAMFKSAGLWKTCSIHTIQKGFEENQEWC